MTQEKPNYSIEQIICLLEVSSRIYRVSNSKRTRGLQWVLRKYFPENSQAPFLEKFSIINFPCRYELISKTGNNLRPHFYKKNGLIDFVYRKCPSSQLDFVSKGLGFCVQNLLVEVKERKYKIICDFWIANL